jgi:hypothetical protein
MCSRLLSLELFFNFENISNQKLKNLWKKCRIIWRNNLLRIRAANVKACLSEIFKLYEIKEDEKGEEITGQIVISKDEVKSALKFSNDLLYGEITLEGAFKVLDAEHLNIWNAETVCELGMGIGKIPIMIYHIYPHVKKIYGIEFSLNRFTYASEKLKEYSTGRKMIFTETLDSVHSIDRNDRSVHYEHGDLLDHKPIYEQADIIFLQTHFHPANFEKLANVVKKFKKGSRIISYENLDYIGESLLKELGIKQLLINMNDFDRFATSWSADIGHHFFLYFKV